MGGRGGGGGCKIYGTHITNYGPIVSEAKFDLIVLCRSQEVKCLDTSSYQKNIPEIQYPPVDGIVEQKIIVKCQALMCKFNGAGGAEVPFPGSRS